jgi:hypothetical protein
VNEFEDLQERVFTLYSNGRFAEIRELLDGVVDSLPESSVPDHVLAGVHGLNAR